MLDFDIELIPDVVKVIRNVEAHDYYAKGRMLKANGSLVARYQIKNPLRLCMETKNYIYILNPSTHEITICEFRTSVKI